MRIVNVYNINFPQNVNFFSVKIQVSNFPFTNKKYRLCDWGKKNILAYFYHNSKDIWNKKYIEE